MRDLNDLVIIFLKEKFKDDEIRCYHDYVLDLWAHYFDPGLATSHFVKEFTNGREATFQQRLWELMLARHLTVQCHQIAVPNDGPDFRFEYLGQIIWVEAISSEPTQLLLQYINGLETGKDYIITPYEEILLRWTSAFKEKFEKLKKYLKQGLIKENDAYIIAISGAQLSGQPIKHGESLYHLALETVFLIGSFACSINPKTGEAGKSKVLPRFSIKTANGSDVKTKPFLDKQYICVSAILGFSGDWYINLDIPACIVHNPYAHSPIPRDILGQNAEEWHIEHQKDGGHMNLIRHK